MKTTMFARILIATLLPVLLVFIVVIGTIHNILYQNEVAYSKESARIAVKHISEQAGSRLKSAAVLQNNISRGMAIIDFELPGAKQNVDGLLGTLLESNPDLYCAWVAFEPGVFPGSGRYYKTMLRTDDGARVIPDLSDKLLDDPEQSPWYNNPLSTGEIYTDVTGFYNYGLGEGFIHAFTMTFPIVADGRIIGCVGLDIRYEDLFQMHDLVDTEVQRIMLLSTEGTILYSPDESDIGNALWDFNFKNTEAISRALHENVVWQEEIQSPFSGEKSLVCLYPVEIRHTGQTIYLYRDIPVDNLYGLFSPTMELIVTTGALGMILLAFSVFFTTRGIVRHIKRITDSFRRVADGGAEVTLDGEHIPIHQTNVLELDILQSALVSMMMQLRKAHDLRLQTVEAEIEKEKLVASSEAKTNFFAVMSHEIRTPMNAIFGIAEIMLLEGNLTQAQKKYIEDIKISSDDLLNIINDVLDISKLETGRMELHPGHYNFRALVDNIVSLAAHLAGEAGLQFNFEKDGELPLCLYGDGTRLRQVLLNLVGNAVKFTRKGFVLMRITVKEETLRFDVVDSGIGIKESEIEAVFEYFKRIDTRRNREIRGTGLGLSISKNLVDLMGGSISAKSVHGAGSTFSVTIPLIWGDEKELRQVKDGAGARYSDSLRVLVVDDNEINLNVSSGLLRAAHGIRCDTAISGREAIAKVREADYDIIFMDHMMPELDGVDTTQCIRQLGDKYKKIPIIALTANAVSGTREELMGAGMDDFLTKPIQSGRLQEVLCTWVPKEKWLPDAGENSETVCVVESGAPEAGLLSDSPVKDLLEPEGVDTLAGLENIGFDTDMYLQSLRLLRDKIPQTVQLLTELLEQQNMREFRIHVHGLKGSLSSIGAAALSDHAKRLELAASEDDVNCCRTLLQHFTVKLRQFREKLDEALPDAEKIAGGEAAFDAARLESGLQKLCSALEGFNYEAVTEELHSLLSMDYGPEKSKSISQVKLLIDSFDYPGALTLIRDKLSAREQNSPDTRSVTDSLF